MNWLILAFALQLGYTPNNKIIMYQPAPRIDLSAGEGVVGFDAELRMFDFLYIGGDLAVPFWKMDGIGFWPNELQSIIKAGIRYRGIEIGWSHICTHPVIPYFPSTGTQILWEGWADEFHIKFSGEINLF